MRMISTIRLLRSWAMFEQPCASVLRLERTSKHCSTLLEHRIATRVIPARSRAVISREYVFSLVS